MGSVFLVLVLCISMMGSFSSAARFDELFQPSWATDHFIYEGELLKMKLDNFSGTFFFFINSINENPNVFLVCLMSFVVDY